MMREGVEVREWWRYPGRIKGGRRSEVGGGGGWMEGEGGMGGGW